jgi:hypothetical protein
MHHDRSDTQPAAHINKGIDIGVAVEMTNDSQ